MNLLTIMKATVGMMTEGYIHIYILLEAYQVFLLGWSRLLFGQAESFSD